jgi:hypothetical protein
MISKRKRWKGIKGNRNLAIKRSNHIYTTGDFDWYINRGNSRRSIQSTRNTTGDIFQKSNNRSYITNFRKKDMSNERTISKKLATNSQRAVVNDRLCGYIVKKDGTIIQIMAKNGENHDVAIQRVRTKHNGVYVKDLAKAKQISSNIRTQKKLACQS